MPHTFSYSIAETGQAGSRPTEATPVPPSFTPLAGTVSKSVMMAALPAKAAVQMLAPAAEGEEGNNCASSLDAVAPVRALPSPARPSHLCLGRCAANAETERPLPMLLSRLGACDIHPAPPPLIPIPLPWPEPPPSQRGARHHHQLQYLSPEHSSPQQFSGMTFSGSTECHGLSRSLSQGSFGQSLSSQPVFTRQALSLACPCSSCLHTRFPASPPAVLPCSKIRLCCNCCCFGQRINCGKRWIAVTGICCCHCVCCNAGDITVVFKRRRHKPF